MYRIFYLISCMILIICTFSSCVFLRSTPPNVLPSVVESAVIDFRNESDMDIENAVIIARHASYGYHDQRLEFPLPVIKIGDRLIFIINVSYITFEDPYKYSQVRINYQGEEQTIIDEWQNGFRSRGVATISGGRQDFSFEIFNTSLYWGNEPQFGYSKPYDLIYEWNGEAFVEKSSE